MNSFGFFVPKVNNADIKDEVVLNMNGLNYVQMNYGNQRLILLIDSGASSSILFSENVHINKELLSHSKLKIKGIAGCIFSKGTAKIALDVQAHTIQYEFLFVNKFIDDVDGILGADFFTKFGATIDYRNFEFHFWINNEKISLPLQSKHEIYTTLPPRCEIIKYFKCESREDHVIINDELCSGVFVAGLIVTPKNNTIPVRFLNVNECPITLKNFQPRVESLSHYELLNFDTTNNSVKRVDKVLDLINVNSLHPQEKNSIEKICAKYADVFHLENDPLTVTNVCNQSIHLKQDVSPVYVKPYRLPQVQKDEINSQIGKLIQDGIIEETRSEWSSPLLVVPKKPIKWEKRNGGL